MQILHAGPFDYPGLHGFPSRCKLWVGTTDLHTFVLARELPDNPGTSVTNAVEILQSRICQEHSLTPERVRWFEWYDHHQCEELLIAGASQGVKQLDEKIFLSLYQPQPKQKKAGNKRNS